MYKPLDIHRYDFHLMKNGKWERDGMITASKLEDNCKLLMAQIMRQYPQYEGLRFTAKGKPTVEMIRSDVPAMSVNADDDQIIVARRKRRSR